jgi:hypothetical protein
LNNESATLRSTIAVRKEALDNAIDIETVNQQAASLKRLEARLANIEIQKNAQANEVDAERSKVADLDKSRVRHVLNSCQTVGCSLFAMQGRTLDGIKDIMARKQAHK